MSSDVIVKQKNSKKVYIVLENVGNTLQWAQHRRISPYGGVYHHFLHNFWMWQLNLYCYCIILHKLWKYKMSRKLRLKKGGYRQAGKQTIYYSCVCVGIVQSTYISDEMCMCTYISGIVQSTYISDEMCMCRYCSKYLYQWWNVYV